MYHFRLLTEKDFEQVHAIELACFANPWSAEGLYKDIRDNPCAVYIGFCEDEAIIGYGGMWIVVDEAHITNFAILPQYRRQGLGRQLLRSMVSAARRARAQDITLEVRPSNKAAIALYESEGFAQNGLRKRYYQDNGEDALIYWLRPIPFAPKGIFKL